MLGMALAGQPGDIEPPWDEIDAQLRQVMPAVELEVLAAQRGLSAYAYQRLSDADLEAYLAFLKTDSAQYYYAAVSVAIGTVVNEAMQRFGAALVSQLRRVDV
jgi:hypothetical protein